MDGKIRIPLHGQNEWYPIIRNSRKRRDARLDKRETCACGYAGTLTHSHMIAHVDWPCHFISRYFILMWKHLLACIFCILIVSQGSISFSFYRLVFDVHVYVLLYILYVLCFIVYFISWTIDKSAMTSIKTYIYILYITKHKHMNRSKHNVYMFPWWSYNKNINTWIRVNTQHINVPMKTIKQKH